MGKVLTDEQIAERVDGLAGWEHADGKLRCHLELADFSEAWGLMSRVALIAESMNHHPDWSNSWNTVDIAVVSHDEGGITEACVAFAERVGALLER